MGKSKSTMATLEESFHLTSSKFKIADLKCLPEACNAENCRQRDNTFVNVRFVNLSRPYGLVETKASKQLDFNHVVPERPNEE